MVEISKIQTHIKRLTKLFEERKKILSLTPEKALNAILDSPQPAASFIHFPKKTFIF